MLPAAEPGLRRGQVLFWANNQQTFQHVYFAGTAVQDDCKPAPPPSSGALLQLLRFVFNVQNDGDALSSGPPGVDLQEWTSRRGFGERLSLKERDEE